MLKNFLLLGLISYVLAQDCVSEKAVRDNFLKRHDEIADLANAFHQVEGTLESKYELYKQTCKAVGAKFISAMNYIRLPRCNNDALNSSPKQPRFLEEHFEFVCNLKQSEYNGYLGTIAMEAASESFETCFKPVDKIFATSPSKPQPDFCSDKLPEMHECLKKEFTGDDTSKAEFYQAFTLFFEENLCTGEFNEEIYIRDMEQLRKNFPTYEFLKDSKF